MPRGNPKWQKSQRNFESNRYQTDEEDRGRFHHDDFIAAAKLVAAKEALEERGRGHHDDYYDDSSYALSDDEQDMDENESNKRKQSATAVNVCRVVLLALIVNASVIGVKVRKIRKNRVPATNVPTGSPTTTFPTTLAPTTLAPTTFYPSLLPTTTSPTPKPTTAVFGVGVVVNDDNDEGAVGFGVSNGGIGENDETGTPLPAPTFPFGGGST